MKKFCFLWLLAAMCLSATEGWGQNTMTVQLSSGELVNYDLSEIEKIVWTNNSEEDYVDLGLPSGTLWATRNVGAENPEEYGSYLAWGELEAKSTYDWSTYKYCEGSYKTLTKYNTNYSYGTVDNKTELDVSDDATYMNWGPYWRMPSNDQMAELVNSEYTTTTWTTQNGVKGSLITSKSNGKSIFLPAAGYNSYTNPTFAGISGFYWSRTLDTVETYCAKCLVFNAAGMSVESYNREYGLPVRLVRR